MAVKRLRMKVPNFQKIETWILFVIYFNLFYKAFCNFAHFPSSINYINDIACMILAIALLTKSRGKNTHTYVLSQYRIVLFLFLSTIVGYIIHMYQPFIYLWGIRTLFRYYIFFFACCYYIKKESIEKVFRVFEVALVLNAIAVFVEQASGYKMDYIAGLYTEGRTIVGGLAGLNAFLCIVIAYELISYFNKKTTLAKLGILIVLSLYMAAVSELKAFFFELVLILVASMLISKISLKIVFGAGISGIGLAIGLVSYQRYYAYKGAFFSISEAMKYIGAEGNTYGHALLNRYNAVPYVWYNFLHSILDKLFGLGLGYADNVSFSLFSSGFYTQHALLGYQFWTVSLELTNIGIIGLAFILLFYVSIIVYAKKTGKSHSENKMYFDLAMIVAGVGIFLCFYNQSLILDVAAFPIMFVLSLPFVYNRTTKAKGELE